MNNKFFYLVMALGGIIVGLGSIFIIMIVSSGAREVDHNITIMLTNGRYEHISYESNRVVLKLDFIRHCGRPSCLS